MNKRKNIVIYLTISIIFQSIIPSFIIINNRERVNELFTSDLNKKDDAHQKNYIDDLNRPKQADLFDLTGSPIRIRGTTPIYSGYISWAQAVSQPWCTYVGGVYIIENVYMDGQGGQYGIEIRDSNVQFIIRNCIVTNVLGISYEAAIHLDNTNNGIIMNNNCSYSNVGITLYENCRNNKVINNVIHNNSDDGIDIYQTYSNPDNVIINNRIENNTQTGIEVLSGYNLVIQNNNIRVNEHGLHIYDCDNTKVLNNNFEENSYDGIWFGNNNNDNNFTENYFSNNGDGINHFSVSANWNNFIYKNYFISDTCYDNMNVLHWNNSYIGNYWYDYTGNDNDGDGIGDSYYNVPPSGSNKDYKPIHGNPFYDGGKIHIDDSGISGHTWAWFSTRAWGKGLGTEENPYILDNFNIDGQGDGSCIIIGNSTKYFRIENCTLYNSGSSFGNAGISLDNVNNGILINNNCSNNSRNGINLDTCGYNLLLNNTLNSNSDSGLFMINSNINNITANILNNNSIHGIRIDYCNQNTIFDNKIYNNSLYGIFLFTSDSNNFTENHIYYSGEIGIHLDNEDTSSDNNLIYINWFIENTINAKDNGTNNKWDNGSIGNYWDDYVGCDNNGDGIGETAYSILGDAIAQDNYPICNKSCSLTTDSDNGGGGGSNSSDGDDVIPFGDFYFLFTIISVISLIFFLKRKVNIKKI